MGESRRCSITFGRAAVRGRFEEGRNAMFVKIVRPTITNLSVSARGEAPQ